MEVVPAGCIAIGSTYPDQIGALVVPSGALGGEAVLASLKNSTPVIAVSNPSVLKVTSDALMSKDIMKGRKTYNLIEASNYVEAAGFLTLLREGISIDSLKRPFPEISRE